MRSAIALLAIGGLSLIALAGFALSGGSATHAQSTITIQVGDFWFCDPSGPQPCSQPYNTIVNVGDTVVWEWGPSGAGTAVPHTTTHCADDLTNCDGPREWDSPAQASGDFSYSFGPEDAGKTFLYRCQIHPFTMRGAITVLAAASTPTPTPTPTPNPPLSPQPTPQPSPQVLSEESTPSAGPTPVGVQAAAIPAGGGEPPYGGGASVPWWLTLAGGGLVVATVALALRRLRR